MSYFDPKFIDFFEHLAGHNYKERFHENRSRYEESVKDPFDRFLVDLIHEVSLDDPRVQIEPKHAKFRINRDIRFSKNKEPYKLNVSGVISQGGRKDMVSPGIYVQLGQGGLHIGAGLYHPDKYQLYAMRTAVTKHPKKFKTLLKSPQLTELFGEMKGEKNKRIAKEFRDAAHKQPLIYNKQFYFYVKYPPKDILREDLLEFVMQHWFAAKEWGLFVEKAMKQYTMNSGQTF